tara:strand:- start:6543 stop:6803 length:261 start_codon:yes stop_codon:yes gene_type:complete
MLQGILAKKVLDMVLKQIFKKFDLDKINKYVNEDNELDKQVSVLQSKLAIYGKYFEQMEVDIATLKKDSHKPIEGLEKRLKKLEKK